ncbi:hypothetical protein [Psychroserpens sp. MEBiC05023]
MKKLALLCFSLCIFNCSKDPSNYIQHVEGYWEIQEVTLSNGTKKEYTFSNTIDYIEVSEDMSGFRKKLKPNLVGTFETSKIKETFSIKIENDSLNVYYQTPYANWKETILNATETQLKIVNTNKDVYLYKRYQPLELE